MSAPTPEDGGAEAVKLTDEQRALLSMRSERNKFAIPVDRSLAPPGMGKVLGELLNARLVVHLDTALLSHLPQYGQTVFDIYELTPAGCAALAADQP